MEKKGIWKGRMGLIVILPVMLAAAGACFLYMQRAKAADEGSEPVLEYGQEYVYAKITSISGNEMEYAIVEAQTAEAGSRPEGRGGQREGVSGESSGYGSRNAAAQGGGQPPTGNRTDMGSMPPVGEMPDMGSMPDAEQASSKDKAGGAQNTAATTYTETGRTGQMQIPVGTEVETKLGTVTTFSRLSGGNVIKMLIQEDGAGDKALIKIWIVG